MLHARVNGGSWTEVTKRSATEQDCLTLDIASVTADAEVELRVTLTSRHATTYGRVTHLGACWVDNDD